MDPPFQRTFLITDFEIPFSECVAAIGTLVGILFGNLWYVVGSFSYHSHAKKATPQKHDIPRRARKNIRFIVQGACARSKVNFFKRPSKRCSCEHESGQTKAKPSRNLKGSILKSPCMQENAKLLSQANGLFLHVSQKSLRSDSSKHLFATFLCRLEAALHQTKLPKLANRSKPHKPPLQNHQILSKLEALLSDLGQWRQSLQQEL